MKKKILSFLTLLFMAAALLPANVTVFAANNGSCGENITWTLDDNGTLTIRGTGDMTELGASPWGGHNIDKNIKNVIIEKGVTSISNYAFEGHFDITSITIPDSVTSIGKASFVGCYSLTCINVDENNVNYCSVNRNLFNKAGTELIQYAAGKSDTEFIIPEGVTSIGDSAFSSCSSLTSITIPDSVTSIGKASFVGCYSLTCINVDENNAKYCSVDGNLFNKAKTELIQYAAGKSDTGYIIPDGVTSIGDSAFYWCTSLTSITIPNSVTSIGDGTFHWCTDLTNVTIPNSVTSIGQWAFSYCYSLTSITIPDSMTNINEYAFCGCKSLRTITIPKGVTNIIKGTFVGCSSLTSITIPNSVTSIGYYAFSDCDNLKTVYYKGNQSEWNNIGIGNDNDCLENAEIIYLKQTNLNVSKEGNTVTVKPVNIESGNVVILALYNEKGLVEMQKKPYTGEDITFPVNKTYTLAKVMVWDSLENMKPICAAETVD